MISLAKIPASFNDVPLILGIDADPKRCVQSGRSLLKLREVCNDLEYITGDQYSELDSVNNLAEYAVRLSELKAIAIQKVSAEFNAAILDAIGYAVDDE